MLSHHILEEIDDFTHDITDEMHAVFMFLETTSLYQR